MDIFSHAVVGAATGALYGQPLLGALVAIAPDLAIAGPRKLKPTHLYKASHSLFAIFLVSCVALPFGKDIALVAVLSYASHIFLDAITHCREWQPRFLWPSDVPLGFKGTQEWEFFNASWFLGLLVAVAYCLFCLWIL